MGQQNKIQKMFILLASLITTAFCINNEFPLGGGLQFKIPEDNAIERCVIQFDVPADAAGADCKIEFERTRSTVGALGEMKFNYWTKHVADVDAFTSFSDSTDKLTLYGDGDAFADAPCSNADALITAIIKKDKSYYVYNAESKPLYTAKKQIKEGESLFFYFETTAAAVAHFNIDYSSGSKFDSVHYYWAKTLADVKDSSKATEVDGDSNALVKVDVSEAGKYWFRVTVENAVAGQDTTTFEMRFKLNSNPTDLEHGDARCPLEKCVAEDMQVCDECTKNGCNWCEGTRKCQKPSLKCANSTAPVVAEDKCVDIDAKCKALTDKDAADRGYGACTQTPGCVYCDTAGKLTFGLGNSGSCSAGRNNLGKDCSSLTAFKATEPAQCSGAAVLTASMTLLAATLAFLQ